jgi:hypothetical protein
MTSLPNQDDELYLRVGQAWELGVAGSPYFVDACQAIVEWHDRRPLARLERRKQELAGLVRLLHETDPDRLTARRAAA